MLENDFFTLLQDNWAILLSLVWLIWSYANLKGHVWQLHIKVRDNESLAEKKWNKNDEEHRVINKKMDDLSPAINEIKVQLARIETTLKIHFKWE